MTVWALQDNIAFSFSHPILAGFRLTLIHTFTVHSAHTFSCRYTHTYEFALFSVWIYLVIHVFWGFFLAVHTEVRVCWRQRKRRRAGKFQICVWGFKILYLDLEYWVSSYTYQAILTIITQHFAKKTCLSFSLLKPSSSPAKDEAIWKNMAQLGEMLKRAVGLKSILSIHVPVA